METIAKVVDYAIYYMTYDLYGQVRKDLRRGATKGLARYGPVGRYSAVEAQPKVPMR